MKLMQIEKVELELKVSKIFHDIKGPLVSIGGYLQLLKEDLAEVNVEIDYIDILLDSSNKMHESIETAQNEVNKLLNN
jgi:signal transduction histidine kinase